MIPKEKYDDLIERWESAVKHYNRRFIDNGVESIAIRKSLIDDTISHIESLQAQVSELMDRCLQKDQQKSYMSKMVDDLQARLAKYEDES